MEGQELNGEKSKHGILYYIGQVLIILLVILIAAKAIYEKFLDPQRNLPPYTSFFSAEQIQRVPDYTVEEFSKQSISDKLDGDFIRITNAYTYGQSDSETLYTEIYGSDQVYPIVVRFHNYNNMLKFCLNSISSVDTVQLFGKVSFDEDNQLAVLGDAWILTKDLDIAFPDETVISYRVGQAERE